MTGLSPAPHRKGIPGGACKDVVHDNTLETAPDSSFRRPDRQQGTVENRGKGSFWQSSRAEVGRDAGYIRRAAAHLEFLSPDGATSGETWGCLKVDQRVGACRVGGGGPKTSARRFGVAWAGGTT